MLMYYNTVHVARGFTEYSSMCALKSKQIARFRPPPCSTGGRGWSCWTWADCWTPGRTGCGTGEGSRQPHLVLNTRSK